MAYKVTMSGRAAEDLDCIVEYIAVQLCNLTAAQDFVNHVDDHITRLETTPFMFPLCEDAELAEHDYHKAVIDNYIMLYTINDEARRVRIARLFYARENYAMKV